jgi:starch phosphorylase
MVADYVHKLYVPASTARSALTLDVARNGAAFKERVRAEWHAVRVDHVESVGVGEAPQVGDEIRVRAFVTLGAQLAPRDVHVQLVYGRVSPSDTLTDLVTGPLQHVEELEGGRHRFEGTVRLRRTGPFGYTVRVLPRVEGAASPAELALVTNASL